jgi:hypothetical protein
VRDAPAVPEHLLLCGGLSAPRREFGQSIDEDSVNEG